MFSEITVIVPCFNRQDFLPRLLRSLNDQDIDKSQFKVIIVDDGSDAPINLNFEDYNFKINLIRHDNNKGLPASLNTAIKNVNTRYFVRIDSDDYVHQSFLKILKLKFELEPDIIASAVDYQKVDLTERILGIFSCDENPIGCGIMFRTEIIKMVGNYNEEMLLGEEVEFRKRVDKKFKIHRIALPLYRYVKHDSNITNNKELYEFYKGKVNE